MATFNVVLGGAAGQGINTTEEILTKVLKQSGFNIFSTKEYMSRVRGGINTTTIRISSEPVKSYAETIDVLVPFTSGVVKWCRDRMSENTIILGEERIREETGDDITFIPVDAEEMAKSLGNKLFINTILSGLLCGLFKADKNVLNDVVRANFEEKGESIAQKNADAAFEGYKKSEMICKEYNLTFDVKQDPSVGEMVVMNGAEAVCLGALNGGCNFVSFYPMSPATTVAIELVNYAEDMGIIVEQFEDEIAAVNASIGAWFGGGRGFVTTSGGGFALMCEGISLAGMAEVPLVIHLAQRPGPATGLPTRTAQGDLNLALYAGHGEFPRILFAPSDISEAYDLTTKSFDLADRYQIPVIILTDEYLVDTYYNVGSPSVSEKINRHIVKMDKTYKRYALTENGVSPRGIPGYGEGVLIFNGNEHDEYGDTTEDADLTTAMQNKRMNKLHILKKEVLAPKFYGNEHYHVLLISWGSTFDTVKSIVKKYQHLAMLHFSQVYPLADISSYLKRADNVIAIEQNNTGQFADLIQRELCFNIDKRILKYDGRQISEEFLEKELSEKGVL